MEYNLKPRISIKGNHKIFQGYEEIFKEIKRKIDTKIKYTIAIECYPGIRYQEIKQAIKKYLQVSKIICSDDYTKSEVEIDKLIERNITDDRVFGLMSHHNIEEFFDDEKLEELKTLIKDDVNEVVVVYGVGASTIIEYDLLVYADLARWEIQCRYRSGEISNWKANNYNEDPIRMNKRGFFFEWRVADRIKKKIFNKIDYLLDTNLKDEPKMITSKSYKEALDQIVRQPFRLVPYFDPGVWGGNWMQEKFGLDKNAKNFAWSFDGVPEENSVYMDFNGTFIEIPSINLVFTKPIELLGDKVHARFGTEFPIRFDYLDTMGGSNLSLQVHPLIEYIQEHFGMNYTQDESYYYLESKEDTVMYLGLKEGVNKKELIRDLKGAQDDGIVFPDEKYIYRHSARKHDHFLIPAGTVHCGGSNGVVLEISATPYIFTFKLWDWGRTGLDGLPRPVHIEHGERNIQLDFNEKWVKKELINQIEEISKGDGWIEERTGLHKRQFIETRRHWFTKKVKHNTHDSVNMLNLVEGDEIVITSPDNSFEPFYIHYGETFIIPENIKEYEISPSENAKAKNFATIKAFVR